MTDATILAELHAAQAFMASGSLDAAEKHLRAALSKEASNAVALACLALCFHDRGKVREAGEMADAAVAAAPDLAFAHFAKGAALRADGKLDEALEAFQGAMRLEAPPPLVAVWLADILREKMRWSEAEAVLRTAHERDPSDATAVALLARVLVDQRRYDDAEPVVRTALDLAPDNITALVSAGHLALARGNTQQASDLVLWALQLAPTDPPAIELFCVIKAKRYPVFALWLQWCRFVMSRGPKMRRIVGYAPTVVIIVALNMLRSVGGLGQSAVLLGAVCISLTLWSAPLYVKYLIKRENRSVMVRPTY